ncbi:MAG: cell division protein FtsQ/DivIB [Gammaproteobacteria bacterium]
MISARRSANRRLPPTRSEESFNLRRSVCIVFGLLALAVVGAAVVWITDPSHLPLRSVRVDGDFRHLSAERLRQVVASKASGGFFNVNVQAIRTAVMADPWVSDVSVRRIWPDQLHVTIHEQRAIAYWGDHSLLSDRGKPFTPPASTFPVGLVHLTGPQGSEALVIRRYSQLADWFRPLGLRIRSVTLNDRRSWAFSVDGAFDVIVGRTDFEARVQRLVATLPRASERLQNSAVIDLRYTDGFAVRPRVTGENDAG